MSGVRLLDERSGALRDTLATLLRSSRHADLALSRVRLATLELNAEEVGSTELCRVLLGRLDASALEDVRRSGRADHLERLATWLDSGRLLVRSAGIRSWTPDFSVFEDSAGGLTSLVGAHYFGSPHLTVGPSFTILSDDVEPAGRLRTRFQEEWDRAHDVAPAIRGVLIGTPS